MKIKSIAAICKKNKNIAIFERYSDDGDILTQYIGDGSAVYPVVGLPQLDKESLLTIFDVPEKDRDNYFVKTLGVPAGISFEDTDETERHVEREGISIIYSGRTLKPIRTRARLSRKARWRTMPKMTVRVILKSGVKFSIKCDKFTLTRNGFQQVTGYNIEGITENKPVYLDFEQVAAVVRVFADEKPEADGNAEKELKERTKDNDN